MKSGCSDFSLLFSFHSSSAWSYRWAVVLTDKYLLWPVPSEAAVPSGGSLLAPTSYYLVPSVVPFLFCATLSVLSRLSQGKLLGRILSNKVQLGFASRCNPTVPWHQLGTCALYTPTVSSYSRIWYFSSTPVWCAIESLDLSLIFFSASHW